MCWLNNYNVKIFATNNVEVFILLLFFVLRLHRPSLLFNALGVGGWGGKELCVIVFINNPTLDWAA